MIHRIHRIVWGPTMLIALIALGIIYSTRSGLFRIRKMECQWQAMAGSLWNTSKSGNDKGFGSDSSGNKSRANDKHPVTRVQAACIALVATVGTDSIMGMAIAPMAGNLGTIFWIWVSAAIGMMTAYAETSPGIRYRYQSTESRWICGPVVYLEKGSHIS